MKSTLFASTLASALTATSFGQVEVQLAGECCGNWNYTYQNEVLTFITADPFGYTAWNIQVPEDTLVQFTCSMLDPNNPFIAADSDGPLTLIADTWAAQGQPSFWTGTVLLPAGNYFALLGEFQGTINFNYELEAQGSCCVNSGCASIAEAECSEMGGTWTEGGSCDDCEPVADDCPADTDGDGIPDVCDADQQSVYFADSFQDFSHVQGEKGWRYRWSESSDLSSIQDMGVFIEENECTGGDITLPRWKIQCDDEEEYLARNYAHPDEIPTCVIPVLEYTVPFTGDAFINLSLTDDNGSAGDGTKISLLVRDEVIGTWVLNSVGQEVSEVYIADVLVGDTIRLTFDSNGCTSVDGDGVRYRLRINNVSSAATASYWDPASGGNGHWYAVVESEQVLWDQAVQEAELLGGHLATLTSAEENQFILPLVPSVITNPGAGYLIGGRDFGSGWEWITGEPFSYASWGDGTNGCIQQPDGRDAIDLYCVNGDGSLSWADHFLNWTGSVGYVVEWSIGDCNSNGIIDSCENVPDDCGNEAEPCPADIDGDGSIGFSDVLIILNDWGACP